MLPSKHPKKYRLQKSKMFLYIIKYLSTIAIIPAYTQFLRFIVQILNDNSCGYYI